MKQKTNVIMAAIAVMMAPAMTSCIIAATAARYGAEQDEVERVLAEMQCAQQFAAEDMRIEAEQNQNNN